MTPHHRVGRLAGAVGFAAVMAVAPAAPAVAHGGGPPIPDAAYYRTALTGDNVLPPGVTASVDPAGEWLQVGYTGPAEVVVLGYTREPYLRITAGGAEENALSPTTYLNRAGFADLPVDATQAANVAPVWRPIATTGSARWHDHRIHWMGQTQPPPVASDPARPHLVSEWVVHATAAGLPFDIRGTLGWVGKPGSPLSRFAWLILAVANLPFVAAVVVLAVGHRRRRGGHMSGTPTAATPPTAAAAPAPMLAGGRPTRRGDAP